MISLKNPAQHRRPPFADGLVLPRRITVQLSRGQALEGGRAERQRGGKQKARPQFEEMGATALNRS